MVGSGTPGFEPGTIIGGKYRVEHILAAGGQATVAKATHLRLKQPVAIKFPHDDAPRGRRTADRFIREARATFQLRSEHVARVIDVDVEDRAPFIVMEYLEGVDLKQLLASRGPLPWPEAVGLLLQAVDGLCEAHDAGIIHRDLKPSNLFVVPRADGTPWLKVLDFGISKNGPVRSADADLGDLTAPLRMLGTPRYMAPEQALDASSVTAASDIWALGLILQEMLTGKPVFRVPADGDVLAGLLAKDPVPISLLRPDVPAEIERFLLRCLQRAPEHRFGDLRELAEALAPYAPPWAAVNLERLRRPSRSRTRSGQSQPRLTPAVAERVRFWGKPFAITLAVASLAVAVLELAAVRSQRGARETPVNASVLPVVPVGAPVADPAPPRLDSHHAAETSASASRGTLAANRSHRRSKSLARNVGPAARLVPALGPVRAASSSSPPTLPGPEPDGPLDDRK